MGFITTPNPFKELGAIQFNDTQYTQGSPLVIDQTPIQLTNNGNVLPNTPLFLGAPPSAVNWIDPTGKITPDQGNGDSYGLRVVATIDPVQNNRAVTLSLDIGGTQGIILEAEHRFSADAAVAKPVLFNFPHYTLSTFLSNGGTLLISIDGNSTANVYDINFYIIKYFKVR